MNNNKALTLVEIIVAAIILALSMLGLTNLFVSGKRYIMHARARMTGGEIGRLFLDPLNMAVRQDTWTTTTSALYDVVESPGPQLSTTRYCDSDPAHSAMQQPGCPTADERTLDHIVYSATYNFTRNSPISNLTKVKLDVTWTEP